MNMYFKQLEINYEFLENDHNAFDKTKFNKQCNFTCLL